MKHVIRCLTFVVLFGLITGLSAQESNQNSLSNDALKHKLDSITMKVDSLLMDEYDIKKDTTKDGLIIHNAIGFKASTLGLGIESILSVHSKINVRLSLTYFQISGTEQIFEQSVEMDLSHQNIIGGAYIFIDYQVNKFFHLTGGILYRVDKESGLAHPISGITIGGIEIPADIVGSISYAIERNAFAPYLGIGFGKSISLEKKISFSIDGGVYYTKANNVEITASGMLSPTDSDLNKNQITQNISNSGFYPYLSLQLSYRLF